MGGAGRATIDGMNSAAKAVLVGGPDELPRRVVDIADPTEIKIPFRGGYEHFRPDGRHQETELGRLPVYVWFERTEIAE